MKQGLLHKSAAKKTGDRKEDPRFYSLATHASGALAKQVLAFSVLIATSLATAEASVVCGTTAACGGVTRNWVADAATTAWFQNNNWVDESSGSHLAGSASANSQPNSATENACIRSDWFFPDFATGTASTTINCLEIASGQWNPQPGSAVQLSLVGSYFRNLNIGTITTNNNMTISMDGTSAQTFENVDSIANLRLSNPTSVELTQNFSVTNAFTLVAGVGVIYIDKSLTLPAGSTLSIPTGATVEVKSGGTLNAQGGISVTGTLKIDAGGKIVVTNGKSITVNSGGLLRLAGASGSPAVIDAQGAGGNTYGLTVASGATVYASNFSISRTTAAGLNISGTVSAMNNGDFHFIASGGYAVTLNGAPAVPTTWTSVGFFDDANTATAKSLNVSSYTGSIITMSSWAGLGSPASPGNFTNPANSLKIVWGTQAAAALQVTNNTSSTSPAGPNPPTSLGTSSVDKLFASFAFSLNQTATATDINSVKIALDGVNSAGDIQYVKVYIDSGANDCIWQSGTDTLIATLTPTGTVPQSATVSFAAGQLTISGTTPKCIHIVMATSATAQNNDTIAARITSASDVVNSQGYGFSNSAIPPVEGGFTTITSAITVSRWNGGNGPASAAQNWNANAGDWAPSGTPPSAAPYSDCQIGSGYSYPTLNLAVGCQNLSMPGGGELDWANSATVFTVTGSLTLGSGYIFANTTTAANFNFASTTANQSITASTAFPGSLTINNTAVNGTVTLNSNWTVAGSLTLTSGNFIIPTGQTLTLGGNVTINGGTLTVQPGATLKFSSTGSTLTVNSGGTLQIVGNGSQNAMITSSSTSTSYTVTIASGATLKAKYYALSNLGTTGLTVSGTIDSTNNLSHGSFSCPVSGGTLLNLNVRVPPLRTSPTPDGLDYMTFDATGCSPANSIVTTGAPTYVPGVSVTNYSGSLSNCCATVTAPYPVSWSTASNTLQLTQKTTSPATVNQGATAQVMGMFMVQQTAGGSATTTLSTAKITLTGTGSSSDISAARLYYDSSCTGSGGTQLGTTQTFFGSPPTASFSGFGASAPITIAGTPCLRVEYDIAAGATAGNTVGAQIAASGDLTNSLAYGFSGSYAPPVDTGTPAIIGTVNNWVGGNAGGATAWDIAGNWSLGRIPLSTDSCSIPVSGNPPVIRTNSPAAVCLSLTIASGAVLTINAGMNLDLYGSFTNSGTLTNNGTLTFRDSASPSTQKITSTTALSGLVFNKLQGGQIQIGGGALTLNSLVIGAGKNFTFTLGSGDVLTLPAGMSMASATFQMLGNSALKIGNNQTINVTGGTFQILATNSSYVGTAGNSYAPTQSYANSGWIAPSTAGNRWNFTVSGGSLDLTGAILDTIGNNGVVLSGSTILSHFDAVQFISLPPAASLVAALQLQNTGGNLSSSSYTATNVGFNWGATLNSYSSLPPSPSPPTPGTAYNLVLANGSCANGSNSISFSNWFGDFSSGITSPVPQTKVTGTASCPVTMTTSASPVSLLSFTATPYNAAVVLNWVTGLEAQHLGFNVYRSLSPDRGFGQINTGLIRNPVTGTGTIHGSYQFNDRDVSNDATYYYQIEDFSVSGQRTVHGPIAAVPKTSLGAAPVVSGNGTVVSGNQPSGQAGGSTNASSNSFTPDQQVIAPGVTLLARTAHTQRLRIDVPALSQVAVADHMAYSRVTIPGYSSSTDAGRPELPQRIVMVEIPAASHASYTIVQRNHALQTGPQIAPALQWTAANGTLSSSWTLDSGFYGTDQQLPNSPVALGDVTQNQGRYFLPVTITPVAFNPVQGQVDFTSSVIVDLNLSGSPAWNVGAAPSQYGPWSREGGLRIDILKEGLYQLRYSDLLNAGVLGPFDHADLSKLRLFSHATELPLQIHSSTGSFSPGDSFVFFTPFTDHFDSDRNSLILTVDQVAGARMSLENGMPAALPAGRAGFFYRQVGFTHPTFGFFLEPFGENLDHMAWGQFYAPVAAPNSDLLATDINLPHLLPLETVTISASLKGSPGAKFSNGVHHLRIRINGGSFPAQDQFIPSNVPVTVNFRVPGSAFFAGMNHVEFQSMGDLYGGDYDIMTLLSFNVTYPHTLEAENDLADIYDNQISRTVSVNGFTGSDLVAYDVTDATQTAAYTGLQTGPDGNGQTAATFSTGADGMTRRIRVARASLIPLPAAIQLNAGSGLHDPSLGADVLFVGSAALLDAAAPLAELRTQQGFRVKSVDIESIFAEFGQGDRTALTLRNFLQFAATQWQAPALKYVVLVGDGSYDLKNELGYGSSGNLPIHLLPGTYSDYASDNWFVAWNAGDALPQLAIGRIPGATPALITTYVNKVLAYESGSARPGGQNGTANIALITDADQNGDESFDSRSDQLQKLIPDWNGAVSTQRIRRSSAASDALLHSSIINAFGSGASVIHYMGHGAEDRWAAGDVFANADGSQLSNSTYPLVVSMSCLNGYFYEADPNSPVYQSLSDSLLFNPNGGAIATWVSTSLSQPQHQDPYQQALFQILVQSPGIRLGEAIRLAKIQGGWSNARSEVINSWTLLGDPLIQIKLPQPSAARVTDTAPASAPPAAASDDGKNHGGGFLACGMVESIGRGGGGSGPGSAGGTAAAEAGFLLFFLLASRRLASLRFREFESSTSS